MQWFYGWDDDTNITMMDQIFYDVPLNTYSKNKCKKGKLDFMLQSVIWLHYLHIPFSLHYSINVTIIFEFIYFISRIRLTPVYDNTLRWRHNDHAGVSNHQPHGCLLNRSFRRKSKKTSKLRVTGLCAGNSPGTGEFPAQMASYAENVSIWWRHHDTMCFIFSMSYGHRIYKETQNRQSAEHLPHTVGRQDF